MINPASPVPEAFEVKHALQQIRRQGAIPQGELRLLEYVVEKTLAGLGPELHQKLIAADVFGRDLADFDPRSDSIVRTTAAYLRENLLNYYSGPGQSDPVIIELPKGTYVPRFSRRLRLSGAASSRLWSARVALEARTASGYVTAVKHLDTVLAEAPGLSIAWALKAEALASQAIHGSRPRPCLEQAEVCVARALEAPVPAWQAWLAHASVRWALHLDWEEAEDASARALETSAGESSTHVWYQAFLAGRGRVREAIAHLQRNVDQFGYCNPTYLGDLAMLHILARDYATARTTILGALEAAPHFYQHHMNLAVLEEAEGNPAAALRVLDAMPIKLKDRPVTWGLRGMLAGLAGAPSVAQRRVTWLKAASRTGTYVPPLQLAICRLGAGDIDGAVRELERSFEDRDPLIIWFHIYPFFRHLRSHPGYQRLLAAIGAAREMSGAA